MELLPDTSSPTAHFGPSLQSLAIGVYNAKYFANGVQLGQLCRVFISFAIPAIQMLPSFANILVRTPSPTSVFACEAESASSTYSSPNLQYLDVAPLSQITLIRGAARVRVDPYSALHARLTGHRGTPTPISTNPTREVEAQQNLQGEPSFLSPLLIHLPELKNCSRNATRSQALSWWPNFTG